jgi:hypothetical protein
MDFVTKRTLSLNQFSFGLQKEERRLKDERARFKREKEEFERKKKDFYQEQLRWITHQCLRNKELQKLEEDLTRRQMRVAQQESAKSTEYCESKLSGSSDSESSEQKLKVFHLKPGKNPNPEYDYFDSSVVLAKDADTARYIYPGERGYFGTLKFEWWKIEHLVEAWDLPENLIVEEIDLSDETEGVLCSSYREQP